LGIFHIASNHFPSDVIGAGTAIGLVGEWQAAVDFLNKASNAGKFGQVCVKSFPYSVFQSIVLMD
jgi:hypothetical protein